MKRFLCTSDADADSFKVSLEARPEDALSRSGRASPLLAVAGDDGRKELPTEGAIAFLVPASPQSLLSTLIHDMDDWVRLSAYLTHGLAAVVLITERVPDLRLLLAAIDNEVYGFELWLVRNGEVVISEIETCCRLGDAEPCSSFVSDAGLDFEVAAQVRQFNSNIALFAAHSARFSPEYTPLIKWLCESVTDIAADHGRLASEEDLSHDEIRRLIGLESLLVELNAILTLFISQATSGALPLRRSSYPVGEYSLLGVSGMLRAIWSVYEHVNGVFSQFDHVGRIQERYRGLPAFDPFTPANRVDFSVWKGADASLSRVEAVASPDGRVHIPHFSSRWGFHESFYGMSVSWQCIHASATKEWNLLTITHEFLHSHVRDVLNEFLDVNGDLSELESIIDRFNRREIGTNARQSMQVALVEALVGINAAGVAANRITKQPQSYAVEIQSQVDSGTLVKLVREHAGYVHELIVHVLDYLYVYDGRDDAYINSVWSSWSLVPIVNDRIDHYVLRTLCALTVTADVDDPNALFGDVADRLLTLLEPLQGRERSRPAIDAATSILRDPTWRKKLDIELRAARYVVKLAQYLLHDDALHAELVRDSGTTVHDDRRTYALNTGEFRGEAIESPVGLLLDRFAGYRDQADEDVEYESVWQMLMVI